MSAGNADGILIMTHNSTPSLSTLIDGDTACNSTGDFRVAVTDSGGADYNIAFAQIFSVVTNRHLDAQLTQVQNGLALGHIGTLDLHTHSTQDFCQRAHGDATDTNQVDTLAGNQIIINRTRIVHHKKDILSKAFCVAGTKKAVYNHYKASYYITGKRELQWKKR